MYIEKNETKKLLFIILLVSVIFFQAQEIEHLISTTDNPSGSIIQQDSIHADYKIKRLSIGLKAGVPNIASVGVQYTLPFLNNHLAPYFEYSLYSHKDGEIEASLKFSEFGASCFFNEKGKGLYFGLGVSTLKVDTRARGRYANIKIENTGVGESWRFGTFQVDIQPDGRRG